MPKDNQQKIVYDGFAKVIKEDRIEVVKVTDSVSILIRDKTTDQFVFTLQQRSPMKQKYSPLSNPEGTMLETPAGRFDINLTVKQLMIKEVKEETGITITEDDIWLLNDGESLACSPGILTEKIFLAYAEVESKNIEKGERIFGVKEEGEIIKRVFIPVKDVKNMFFEDMKTFALVQWFFANK